MCCAQHLNSAAVTAAVVNCYTFLMTKESFKYSKAFSFLITNALSREVDAQYKRRMHHKENKNIVIIKVSYLDEVFTHVLIDLLSGMCRWMDHVADGRAAPPLLRV